MPSDTPLVAAVSPKLPEFWPQAADVWLAQAEAQFRLAKVTVSQTKFDLAVQRLDRDTALRLQDVLLAPPADDPWTALRERLIAGFTKSTYQRLEEFSAIPPLGDRRPSELLDTILASLSGITHDCSGCPLVQHAFLSRLPPSIRTPLTARIKVDSLRQLASKADEVWSTLGIQPVVAAVDAPEDSVASVDDRRSSQQPPRPQPRRFCYYHDRWGKRAHKCTQPCSWSGNATAGGRRN